MKTDTRTETPPDAPKRVGREVRIEFAPPDLTPLRNLFLGVAGLWGLLRLSPVRAAWRRLRTNPPGWIKHSGIQVAQAISIVTIAVPPPIGYWFSDRFGDYFYRRNTNLRANVSDNMHHVLAATGRPADDATVQRAVRRVFRTQARNAFDLLRVPRISLRRLEGQTDLDGDWTAVDEALAAGRGVILCSAHYGAFDIMGQYIVNRGYDAHLLIMRSTSAYVHDAVTYLRESRGWHMEPVDEPGSLRRVLRALKAGKLVGMVVDRDWTGTGTPVSFFGAETPLPTGHIRMALTTGAEIVALMTPRLPRDRYGVVLRPVPLQRTGHIAADVAENTRRVLATFEEIIGADPGQWVLFRRVWAAPQ